MPRHHPKARFDRRSPVQPGQSPAPYLLLAVVGALSIWGVQQCSIQDSRPPSEPILRRESRTAQIPTEGDVRTVFRDTDYPGEAQQSGQEGTVQARLEIDPSGRVSQCRVIRSSGHLVLDSATCDILRSRARFRPARDSEGKPISGTYVTPPVTWRLADE